MAALTQKHTPLTSSVFERLLADIVSGVYPSGTNLPAERDLARQIGASRPTLREALRRLGEWGLIEAKRSSGVSVCEPRDWSFDVLPAVVAYGASTKGLRWVLRLIKDLLDLRRVLVLEVLKLVAPRTARGSLDKSRAAAVRAFSQRQDASRFQHEAFRFTRAIVA